MAAFVVPATVTLRPATLADAGGIARVHIASWQAAYRDIVPDAVLASMSYDARLRKWEDWFRTPLPESRCFVAEEAGEIIGFANGGPAREAVRDYTGEVYALYLLPAQQRRGIGRALLGTLAIWLRAQGHRSLLVWVLAANPARHFYAHLGGIPLCGQTIDIGGRELPEIAYGWPDIEVLVG